MFKKRVLAFGSFDLVHRGHEYYLNEAKKLGTELIVVIARDDSVELIKGRKPDNNEEQRKKDIEFLGIADKVVLGNSVKDSDKFQIIDDYKPNIIALGYDQNENAEKLKKKFNFEVVRIRSFEPEKYKSSLLKKK